MASRRNHDDRMEPQFGTGWGGSDLRVHEDDRPVRGRKQRRADDDLPPPPEFDDEPPRPARRRKEAEPPPRGKDRSKGRSKDRPAKRKRFSLMGFLFKWTFVAAIWAVLALGAIIAWYAARLPPTHSLEIPPRPPNIAIISVNGEELANRGDTGGASVKLKALPKHVPQALLAIEDRRFYSHFGIDMQGLARALYTNMTRRGAQQGGSTITQQLAKNLFLTPERTMGRKIQEALLALWLESNYSKDDILELYLNRVYFGAGAYGIEAAARKFFSKPATALSLSEAAIIAGLVKAPSKLNPNRNGEAAEARAQLVLFAMAEQGYITEQQAKVAMADPAETNNTVNSSAVNYVADWVMDLIDDYVGKVQTDIRVETTIDPTIQEAAEAALIDELARNGARFDVKQGAVVVMDNNGAVRALVGGRNYAESQFNRAVAAKRQPGSSFKPFVYLAALEKGLTPATLRDDSPVTVKGWKPENYSRDYRGPVPLSSALALSLNTVAVRLGLEVGPKAVARTAQRLGILSKLEANASIALGTSEVSLLELVSAYVPFANGGTGVIPHVIQRIRAADGRTLYARAPVSPGQVIEPQRAAEMAAMLSETVAIGTARKAVVPGFSVAGKTGTSQDYRDAWFIGFTGRYIAGVWIGNDDGKPTRKATGSGLPVEIWAKTMAAAHQGVPPADLPGPWKAIALAARQGRTIAFDGIDEPMRMTPMANSTPVAPSAEQQARPLPQPSTGFFERLFR